MNTLYLNLLFFFLRIAIHFVPRGEYGEKLDSLERDTSRIAFNTLEGWEYETRYSENLKMTHEFYSYNKQKRQGPLVLLVHGLILDGRTYKNTKQLNSLGPLIAYNLPMRSDYYTGKMDDFSVILRDFLSSYDMSRGLVICGVSAGGGIAVHLASDPKIKKPECLILLSTQLNRESDLKKRQDFAQWLRSKKDYQLVWLMEKILSNYKNRLTKAERDSLDPILYLKHPQFYRQAVYAQSTYNGIARAKKVTAPTLVLRGEKDHVISEKAQRYLEDAFSDVVFETVPNASHVMTFMKGEVVAQRIRDFCSNSIVSENLVKMDDKDTQEKVEDYEFSTNRKTGKLVTW